MDYIYGLYLWTIFMDYIYGLSYITTKNGDFP